MTTDEFDVVVSDDPAGCEHPSVEGIDREPWGPADPDLYDDTLRALSLWQPWAQGIVGGHKVSETRGYATRYRGWLYVQAAAHKLTRLERAQVDGNVWLDLAHADPMCDPDALPRMAIVAVVRLVDVVPHESIGWVGHGHLPDRRAWTVERLGGPRAPRDPVVRMDERERPWGLYGPGRFSWLLDDVLPLPEPVPCPGGQQLWRPPHDVIDQVDALVGIRTRTQQHPTPTRSTP